MQLVVNCGSSSIKFSLYADDPSRAVLVLSGSAKNILSSNASLSFTTHATSNKLKLPLAAQTSYFDTFDLILQHLGKSYDLDSEINLICHRVVHGGSTIAPILLHDLSDKHLQDMDDVSNFAPLHNTHAMLIVRTCLDKFRKAKNVLCFDTLFHQTIPAFRTTYAIAPNDNPSPVPLRRYGFHGLSYASVLRQMSLALDKKEDETNLIVAHLGSGASVCLIQGGKSVATSMGLTPLEGIVGSTRSGDIDPSLIFHHTPDCSTTIEWNGKLISKAEYVLNKESGLLGLTGTSDFSTILSRAFDSSFTCTSSERSTAQLAYQLYLDRLSHYLSSYLSDLFSSPSPHNTLDALVFSGGIGEHATRLREDVLRSVGGWIETMAQSGGGVDVRRNEGVEEMEGGGPKRISLEGSRVSSWVVVTDEEEVCLRMGRETVEREKREGK